MRPFKFVVIECGHVAGVRKRGEDGWHEFSHGNMPVAVGRANQLIRLSSSIRLLIGLSWVAGTPHELNFSFYIIFRVLLDGTWIL
jgi:hypothetical protein